MAASDYDGRLPEPPYDTDTSAVAALQEECDRLNAQVAALQNERDVLKSLLADNLTAWDGEEDSVKEEHAALIEETREAVDGDPKETIERLRAALEATKEEA